MRYRASDPALGMQESYPTFNLQILLLNKMSEQKKRNSKRRNVYTVANGHWRMLLQAAGVDPKYLVRKAGPCPLCKSEWKMGSDRFSFDDRYGDGDYFCRNSDCGSGKGMKFLMKFRGWDWLEAVDWVIATVGGPVNFEVTSSAAPAKKVVVSRLSSAELERRKRQHSKVWLEARPLKDDSAARYLGKRLGREFTSPELRYHPALPYFYKERGSEKPAIFLGKHPCLVARLLDDKGKMCNIQRIYLREDGSKVNLILPETGEILPCRKLMESIGSRGGAIRLGEIRDGVLGIGEGIETSLAAMFMYDVPTWSAVSTSGIRGFQVPDEVRELWIFADNDVPEPEGKKAAEALRDRPDVQERVRSGSLVVRIEVCPVAGRDFADLLIDDARGSE